MGNSSEKIYPYESEEEVEILARELSDLCKNPQSAIIQLVSKPEITGHGLSVKGLPGNIAAGFEENAPTNLIYMPHSDISLTAHNSPSYLFIRAVRGLGAETLVLYMPAIPLVENFPDVVAISDHINMLSRPPHFGVDPSNGEEMFFPMNDAYDTASAMGALEGMGYERKSGILLGAAPGQFSTNAGHEAARKLGADLISPYIFGQCLIAKRAKMKVIAFAETGECEIDPTPLCIKAIEPAKKKD